jgi:hypothetical protein
MLKIRRNRYPKRYTFYSSGRPSRVTWILERVVYVNMQIKFNIIRRNNGL